MFVAAPLLEQVGGFDESFSMAGGGYANLELYERLGSSPDVTVVHDPRRGLVPPGPRRHDHQPDRRRPSGGPGCSATASTTPSSAGRPFQGPGKPHPLRRPASPRRRPAASKPRRMSTEAFAEAAAAGGSTARPTAPTPVPDELRVGVHRGGLAQPAVDAARPGSGRAIATAPTDLLAYQELIAHGPARLDHRDRHRRRRPRAVPRLDLRARRPRPGASRSTPSPPTTCRATRGSRYLAGEPARRRDVVAQVRELVGDGPGARGARARAPTAPRRVRQFEAYAPLVPVGSYVVVTDTIVNGHPVWPAFGPGPAEAVKQILTSHGEFVADPTMEKYSLTFNPGGFLKRVGP